MRLAPEEQSLRLSCLRERALRNREGLRLYEPLPNAKAFHQSPALERIVIGGNRGGKSVAAICELLWAATHTHPYWKYPDTGIILIVGQKEDSLADPIWKIMHQTGGAFKVMKDPRTKTWRAVRPWNEFDLAHFDLWRGNEPLLPDRLIDGKVSWHVKNKGIPAVVKLKTGWKILFVSDNAEPHKGVIYDLVHFNEETRNWYAEASARLIDRAGRFIWDATPEAGTDDLFKLYIRSQKPLPEGAKRSVECFHLHMLDNPHVPQEQKEAFIEKHKDNPVTYKTKVLGQFALQDSLVFPEFDADGIHTIEPVPIPYDWTRYAVIDPGYETTAVLYFAVPPPSHKKQQLHVYDELYLPRCDAARLARAMRDKAGGNWLHACVMDMRMGNQTQQSGKTVAEQIAEALKVQTVEFAMPGFIKAQDDIAARISRTRYYLGLHRDGYPRMVVHRGRVKWLLWELEKYRYDKDKHGVLTEKPVTKDNHACDALCYGAAADFRWVAPEKKYSSRGMTAQELRDKQAEWWGWGKRGAASYSLGGSHN